MMFSLAKERMESTRLWQIVRKMPKGALLHAHMDAMVDFDYLFNVLLETKGMHIFSKGHLGSEKAREGGPFQFRFQKVDRGMWMGMSQGAWLILGSGREVYLEH
jgi:adenosine deaminase CECR1